MPPELTLADDAWQGRRQLKTGQAYGKFKMMDGRVVTLRSIKRSDLASAVRFVNALVTEKKTNPTLGVILDRMATRRTERVYIAKMLKDLKEGNAISVLAEVGGEVVANSDVRRRTLSREVRHTGVLGIAVLDRYRGLGLGGKMLRVLLRSAKRAGIYVVELEVFSGNRRARRLYKDLGFKVVGTVPGKIRRNRRHFGVVHMYVDLRRN